MADLIPLYCEKCNTFVRMGGDDDETPILCNDCAQNEEERTDEGD